MLPQHPSGIQDQASATDIDILTVNHRVCHQTKVVVNGLLSFEPCRTQEDLAELAQAYRTGV
jgi:hypothetical protein